MATRDEILQNFDGDGEGFITQTDQKNAAGQTYDTFSPLLPLEGAVVLNTSKNTEQDARLDTAELRLDNYEQNQTVGPQGPAGPTGAKGDQGEKGPQGNQGPTGATGADGEDGPPGPSLDFLGEVASVGDLPVDAEEGDAYVVTGPDPDEHWAYGSNGWVKTGEAGVTGPQGPQGVQGETGPQGDTGAKGDKGDTGATGPQGVQGETGPQGVKGDTGADSTVPGPQGETGPQGNPGPQGEEGVTPEWWSGTESEYDAIGVPDPDTLYVIEGTTGPNWLGPMTQAEFDGIATPDPLALYVIVNG